MADRMWEGEEEVEKVKRNLGREGCVCGKGQKNMGR